MADPYIGEIRLFGSTFAPVNWWLCDGSMLPISEYDVLFSLIGTRYGGDGQETFGVPDLRGRVPVHQGQGPGITQEYVAGEQFGVEQVTLTGNEMATHSHPLFASTSGGSAPSPRGNVVGSPPAVTMFIRDTPSVALPGATITPVGGSQPHENRMPFQAVNYIIATAGIYPQEG